MKLNLSILVVLALSEFSYARLSFKMPKIKWKSPKISRSMTRSNSFGKAATAVKGFQGGTTLVKTVISVSEAAVNNGLLTTKKSGSSNGEIISRSVQPGSENTKDHHEIEARTTQQTVETASVTPSTVSTDHNLDSLSQDVNDNRHPKRRIRLALRAARRKLKLIRRDEAQMEVEWRTKRQQIEKSLAELNAELKKIGQQQSLLMQNDKHKTEQ